MLTSLILLLTIVPAVELIVLIKVGSYIGAVNTVLIIIFTGVLGAYLARLQGLVTLYRIQENLNRGVLPTSEMLDGMMILVGGILLLTPGFVTDSLGFLLLIPLTRALIKHWLQQKIQTMMDNGEIATIVSPRRNNDIYDV